MKAAEKAAEVEKLARVARMLSAEFPLGYMLHVTDARGVVVGHARGGQQCTTAAVLAALQDREAPPR